MQRTGDTLKSGKASTMEQTPVHEHHNPDLLRLLPTSSERLIEVGCSSGALAREFKKLNPRCWYLGIEIDAHYAKLAERHCDETMTVDIESLDQDFFHTQRDCDCWIFGDTLEHLRDPWSVLRQIRQVLPPEGCVVACLPNMQHWSLQVKLSTGALRYEDHGLLDRTHLRWFTRMTINELFAGCGFQVVKGVSRVFKEPDRDRFLPVIAEMARLAGEDPIVAVSDAMPLQYVVRATPR